MTPLIIVSGPAGSGKDTVSEMIAQKVGGICIAQADPLKRLGMAAFGFSENQLWGPSESRNAEDSRFTPGGFGWSNANDFMFMSRGGEDWLKSVGLQGTINALERWFRDLRSSFEESGRTLTPRAMLQTLGTEFGRTISPDIWAKNAAMTASTLLKGGYGYSKQTGLIRVEGEQGPTVVIITDGRFRNEIINVTSVGGKAIRICPETPDSSVSASGIANHASEAQMSGIPDFWFDCVFVNNKNGLENLKRSVDLVVLPAIGLKR